MKKQKKIQLSNIILIDDDISLVNQRLNGEFTFGIEILDINIFSDDLAVQLEYFFNENGISADIFNVEYMGFLTGAVRIENGTISNISNIIIPLINDFLKNKTK